MWGISPEDGKTKSAKPCNLELRWNEPKVAPTDPYTVLLSLKQLKDAGVFSEEEYETKKAEQMKRMTEPEEASATTSSAAAAVPFKKTALVMEGR
jgi:hypothetical protein